MFVISFGLTCRNSITFMSTNVNLVFLNTVKFYMCYARLAKNCSKVDAVSENVNILVGCTNDLFHVNINNYCWHKGQTTVNFGFVTNIVFPGLSGQFSLSFHSILSIN